MREMVQVKKNKKIQKQTVIGGIKA